MGRLENIVKRNQRGHWSSWKVLIWGGFAVLAIVSIVALCCTNLATPGVHRAPRVPNDHVDGVLLRKPAVRRPSSQF